MKKFIFAAVAGFCAISSVYAQNRADSIRAAILDPAHPEVFVAVHRGDWRGYAENSLEGIESAIQMGADIVEIDLQRTADGHLVLMHDPTVNRSTSGKGKVSDMTLAEIKQLQLRNGVTGKTPYRVPTLEEVLVATKGRVLLNLDKAFDYFDQVYDLMESTGTTKYIIMKGTNPAAEVKEKYGKYLDEVIYMPVVNIDKPNAAERVQEYIDVLNPPAFEFVYADSANTVGADLAQLIDGRSRIWYNTLWSSLAGGRDDFASLNDYNEGFGYLIDNLGATIIQTDQPSYLIKQLKNRRLKETLRNRDKMAEGARDWAKFYRYADANDSILACGRMPKVVFMGNSITDGWANQRPEFFAKNNIAGRGISGQTTSQMLVRFQSDVIDLKPKAVVILAGTNDIARNNGYITLQHIFQNIKSMCQIAQANGVTPIIASVLPAAAYRWNPTITNPAEQIAELNGMLKAYAAKNGLTYIDYYSSLVDSVGGLPEKYSKDGVHPTPEGYEVMERIALKSLAKYLK